MNLSELRKTRPAHLGCGTLRVALTNPALAELLGRLVRLFGGRRLGGVRPPTTSAPLLTKLRYPVLPIAQLLCTPYS